MIAVVTQTTETPDGELLVKQGSLSAAWNDEYSGVNQVAVATDTANGPLIATLTAQGEMLVKEGTLTAGWDTEHTDTDQVAVAG